MVELQNPIKMIICSAIANDSILFNFPGFNLKTGDRKCGGENDEGYKILFLKYYTTI